MLFTTALLKRKLINFSIQNCMDFLVDLTDCEKVPYSSAQSAVAFLRSVRKLAGDAFSDGDITLIDKYLAAAFNKCAPLKSKLGAWDVNIMLDHLNKIEGNDDLPINMLAGKAILLILITTMCRMGDVEQLSTDKVNR